MKFQNDDQKNMTILMVPKSHDFQKNEKKKKKKKRTRFFKSDIAECMFNKFI